MCGNLWKSSGTLLSPPPAHLSVVRWKCGVLGVLNAAGSASSKTKGQAIRYYPGCFGALASAQ
eukprot:1157627-Pelagomonas_calceolata.AAC.10